MENEDGKVKKEHYLIDFESNEYRKELREYLKPETIELGDEIIKLIKEKSLTYVDAYTILEYVYRNLRIMREFINL